MKKGILTLTFLLFASPALALSLEWSPVTKGTNGQLLENGAEVTSYKVYQCLTGAACNKTNGVVIAEVPAPQTTLDISSQPVPRNYVVTAVNVVGESVISNILRVLVPAPTGAQVMP